MAPAAPASAEATHAAAEAAHTAAHHLTADGADLLAVDDHGAAGKADRAVKVEAGAAGDGDRAAGDDQVPLESMPSVSPAPMAIVSSPPLISTVGV